MSRSILAVPVVLSLLFFSLPAQAVLQRVYVSAISGNDANTATGCPASAPCRWFSTAVSAVDSGGEVVVLDSGAYGAVTITKSVSLIAPEGVYGGITVFSGAGVTVATAGVNVILRGLTINGMGGNNGVAMTDGASLSLENCTVKNFAPGAAVYVNAAAKLRILDSVLRSSYNGAYIAGGARAVISGTRILDNSHEGLYVYASGSGLITSAYVHRSEASGNGASGFYSKGESSGMANLHIKDSAAAGNGGSGALADANGGSVTANVSSSLMSGNNCGIGAQGSGAYLSAFGNTVTANGTGLCQSSSASLDSFRDNDVTGNDFQWSGTIGSATKF
jgi:hypothetical protein